MKILHIINGLTPGGAEVMLLRMVENLEARGIKNEVCCLTSGDTLLPQFQALGVPVVYCTGPFARFTGLRRVLRETDADVIQCWTYHSNLGTALAGVGLRKRVPVFWSIHHSITDLASEKPITRLSIRALPHLDGGPRKIVYVSRASRAQHEEIGYRAEKSVVIPNGYDLRQFQPDKELGCSFRRELGVEPGAFLIGVLARNHPMKDHHNFLLAARRTLDRAPQCRFVLAGRGVTPENPDIRGWIQELDLADATHVLGDRRDVPAILNGLDLLTTSSAYGEAFPIILGEAMACGTPVSATDVGDSSWLIGDERMIAPPSAPDQLADIWVTVATETPASRKSRGETMRRRIEENFSLDSVVNRYLALYEES